MNTKQLHKDIPIVQRELAVRARPMQREQTVWVQRAHALILFAVGKGMIPNQEASDSEIAVSVPKPS
jgi:hypothetical protein